MKLSHFPDPAEFLKVVERELGPHEVEHHLLLGVAPGAVKQSKPGAVLVTVRDDAGLALTAFMTPPRPLLLVTERRDIAAAVAQVAGWLAEHGHKPTAVIADVPVAERFIAEWSSATGATATLKRSQRLYVLREVVPVPASSGTLRQAGEADLDLLDNWMGALHGEAMGDAPDPELRDAVAKRLAAGEFYLWEDGEPRSMAASARPTARGIAINSVYTPPELRRRGYATTCVAALSRRLLDEGREFCVLYTDLANPTSNAIYQRIGYKPVSDSVFYEFK